MTNRFRSFFFKIVCYVMLSNNTLDFYVIVLSDDTVWRWKTILHHFRPDLLMSLHNLIEDNNSVCFNPSSVVLVHRI